jgi:hypothetical protein
VSAHGLVDPELEEGRGGATVREPRRGVARRRRDDLRVRIRAQVRAIRDGDPSTVERAVLDLSRSHRFLAPLAFIIGAFVMLFEALRLLVINWHLMLIQVLPAIWIWLAMLDLKAHLLHVKSFRSWTVDGSLDIAPDAIDLDLGLVDEPPVAQRMSSESGSVGQQRREPLHPPVHRDVIHLDPARSASSSSTSR